MNRKLVITKLHNVRMFFFFEDTKIQAISCYEEDSLIGNIYVGRVSNVLKNLNALFIDISRGESCYLSMEDCPEGKKAPKVGDLLLVQVIKDKIKSKQATVTTKVSITGESVVISLDNKIGISKKITDSNIKTVLKKQLEETITEFKLKNDCESIPFGGIVRTEAQKLDIETFKGETIKILCELKDVINRSQYATAYLCIRINRLNELFDYKKYLQIDELEVVTDDQDFISMCMQNNLPLPRLYEDPMINMASFYNLPMIIEKALQERVYLKSGAYLVIQHTEAMTVIDVNSGKAIKGNNKSQALLNMNLEAAKEIAKQLRIRNLSGIILVDFINMKSMQDIVTLMTSLKEYVASDWVEATVHDMTKLGLIEITRKKVRKPIYEILKNT